MNEKQEFFEGDIVQLIKDYGGAKAGQHVEIECCGEEWGGEENLILIKRAEK